MCGNWSVVTHGRLCTSLDQPLPRRIGATRLSCEAYPKLVANALKIKSFVEKNNTGYRDDIRYGDWMEGKDKAEALIQLDALTPVAYVKGIQFQTFIVCR